MDFDLDALAPIQPLRITKARTQVNLSRIRSSGDTNRQPALAPIHPSLSPSCPTLPSLSPRLPSPITSTRPPTRSPISPASPFPFPFPPRQDVADSSLSPITLDQAVRRHRSRHESWRIACRIVERAEDTFEGMLWRSTAAEQNAATSGQAGPACKASSESQTRLELESAQIRLRIAREEEKACRERVDQAAMEILQLKKQGRISTGSSTGQEASSVKPPNVQTPTSATQQHTAADVVITAEHDENIVSSDSMESMTTSTSSRNSTSSDSGSSSSGSSSTSIVTTFSESPSHPEDDNTTVHAYKAQKSRGRRIPHLKLPSDSSETCIHLAQRISVATPTASPTRSPILLSPRFDASPRLAPAEPTTPTSPKALSRPVSLLLETSSPAACECGGICFCNAVSSLFG